MSDATAFQEVVLALRRYGVDVPFLMAFLAAVALSREPANYFVLLFHEKFIERVMIKQLGIHDTGQTHRDRLNDTKVQLDLETAGVIGRLERVIYVFAFMMGIYALLSGWLVMKAFFSWIPSDTKKHERLNPGASTDPAQDTGNSSDLAMSKYHSYLYGNALSVIAALICAIIGNVVYNWLCALAGVRATPLSPG